MKSLIHTVTTLLLLFSQSIIAQHETMTPETYKEWNKITNEQISDSGGWVSYLITNENDRSDLHLYNTETGQSYTHKQASKAQFAYGDTHMLFLLHPHPDTLLALKKQKVNKDKFPNDTLAILHLKSQKLTKIKNVDSYKLPEKTKGIVAIKLSKRTLKLDTTLVKSEGADNGSRLLIHRLNSGKNKAIAYVKDYVWSDKKGRLAMTTTGNDSIASTKVLLYDSKIDKINTLMSQAGEYSQLSISDMGECVVFIADLDTSKTIDGSHQLFLWQEGNRKAQSMANLNSTFLPKNWQVSPHYKPTFLKYQNKITFGLCPIPTPLDTTILYEEKVNVEIWHYQDGQLHTQQETQKAKEEKKSYTAIHDLNTRQTHLLHDGSTPTLTLNPRHKGPYTLSYTSDKYQKYTSWLGHDYKDLYTVNINTGKKTAVATKIDGRPRIDENGQYIIWYSRIDTSWYAYDIRKKKKNQLTQGVYYDELNDRPMDPYPSGMLGWTTQSHCLIYDHYDIWDIDPTQKAQPKALTQGRTQSIRYRYVSLDKEDKPLPADTTILLRSFDTKTKEAGLAYLDLSSGLLTQVENGPYHYARIKKAKDDDQILFTKENFALFPDLITCKSDFSKQKTISDANPQQADYNWGSIELFKWTDKNGKDRDALIAKPENFDPTKKYPLIVNFYEKSSDRLHQHRAPYAHRSTINYTYYTNKGYLIFNPDIYYEDGYPGESCLSAVNTSVDSLIQLGYVDTTRMGLQGHSWGGYQIAYLLTKTNRFKCAEAGAPVVNMVSAYGGIRWRSGMSRMFQYEKTQSRLGASLWERPDLYLYNSPIFNIDRVKTPVLILHNDKDGAVPWYQGIEYFVALRRLGKPAWMLNYNDEPHWPVKKQNRLDFNIRMAQFFDHYLMDAPMPIWMRDGVPVLKKGKSDGLGY